MFYDRDKVKCDYCGYVIVRPYPNDKLCPNCGKFLKNLFEYGSEEENEIKAQPKEFETTNETASSKFKGKVRVKERESDFDLGDDKIKFKDGNDYIKLLGITSVDRTPLFCSNQKYVYLLELTNNLDYIATSILGGDLDKMLLTSDHSTTEKCQFFEKDEIIYLVYGMFPDKKGKWILEQMAKYYSELVRNKEVDNLSKIEKYQIDRNFEGRVRFILKEFITLQEVFTDQEIPYVENKVRLDYVGLSSMSIGVISLLLGADKLNFDDLSGYEGEELKEMQESLLTAKIEAIAANTLGNTGAYPRWIAVKLGFQNYRFLTFKRYLNDYFLSILSEGNLKKIEKAEETLDPYINHVIDEPFTGNLKPFNRLKGTIKDLLQKNREFL